MLGFCCTMGVRSKMPHSVLLGVSLSTGIFISLPTPNRPSDACPEEERGKQERRGLHAVVGNVSRERERERQ